MKLRVTALGIDTIKNQNSNPGMAIRGNVNNIEGEETQTQAAWSRMYAVAGAYFAIGLGFLPWAKSLLSQTGVAKQHYWTSPLNPWTIPDCLGEIVVPTNSDVPNHSSSLIATVIIAAIILLLMWRIRAVGWLLLSMIVVPLAFAVFISVMSVSVFVPRYFLFSYMFALCAIPYLATRYLPNTHRTCMISMLVFNSLFGHYGYWNSLETSRRPGIRNAAAHIAARRKPGETVVVTDLFSYFSARYYLRCGEAPLLFVPEGKRPEPHHCGGSAVAPDWMIDEARLNNANTDRIWILGTSTHLQTSTFVDEWKPVEKSAASFPEVYYFLGTVKALAYERRNTSQ